jgi:hypothetical protein
MRNTGLIAFSLLASAVLVACPSVAAAQCAKPCQSGEARESGADATQASGATAEAARLEAVRLIKARTQAHPWIASAGFAKKLEPYSPAMARMVEAAQDGLTRAYSESSWQEGAILLKSSEPTMVVSWRVIFGPHVDMIETIFSPPEHLGAAYPHWETLLIVKSERWSLTRDGVDLASGTLGDK